MEGYQTGPVRTQVIKRLEDAIVAAWREMPESETQSVAKDTVMLVRNESHLHKVAPNSERHFDVTIASNLFGFPKLTNRLARHRFVYSAVGDDLLRQQDGHNEIIHMLTIHCFTLEQWHERGGEVEKNPKCIGDPK